MNTYQIDKITSHTPEKFNSALAANENNQLIDVRTPDEYEAGHLHNAQNVNISSEDFKQRIRSFDQKKPILVYCHSGHRSLIAANILKAEGFENIINLDGGILAWARSGFAIEKI
jgi:rhodanese-related sulfurtransferase